MRARAIIISTVLAGALISGGWLVERGLSGRTSAVDGARLFDQVVTHVARYYVDSMGTDDLYRHATVGLLEALGDPHTLYLPPERLARLGETTSGSYGGLGMQIDVRDGWIVVVAPLPNTPAERGGLRTGDRIVEIGGVSTRDWTTDEAQRALRGEPGSRVTLGVETPGETEARTVNLTREDIRVGPVQRAALLRDGVGYVDVNVFGDSTEEELARAVDSLREAGMQSLLLDLRRNPGGLLTEGVAVADLFLDPGDGIVETRGRVAEANVSYTDEHPQRWPDMPVIVLVDEGSASAAEIVAGALQDHDRALVLGNTTFGKGSAQSVIPLPSGGALKLTTARWYTPSGRTIGRSDQSVDPDDELAEVVPVVPEQSADTTARRRFETESGRTVYGGGGIVPDVEVGSAIIDAGQQALLQALGSDITAFRDALTDYAVSLRGTGRIASADFVVTPAMRASYYTVLARRGIEVDSSVYERAEPLVSQLIGREVARVLFGRAAEFRRAAAGDAAIQRALELASGVQTPAQLLERVAGAGNARAQR